MIRFIGGPARVGKTTLAREIHREIGGEYIALDSFKHALIAVTEGERLEKLQAAPSHRTYTQEAWIDELRKRDNVVWEGLLGYLSQSQKNEDDVLIEGTLWPDFVAPYIDMNPNACAVFLGNTDHGSHLETLLESVTSDATHNNWIADKDRAWLEGWSTYNAGRSSYMQMLAQEAHLPFFDTGQLGIEEAQKAARDILLGKG